MLSRRLILSGGAALLAAPALAQSAAAKGETIARNAAARAGGYGDLKALGEMVLFAGGGATATRHFEARWVETGPTSARAVLIFRAPEDIKGTALLTHAVQGRTDGQWLYLPALGQVRRIAAAQRPGSFVGSEFAFEDMADQEIGAYDHTWVQDGPCPSGGGTCHIVDRRPRIASGYSLQRVWFNAADYRVMQVRYFDRRGAHVKTLTMANWQGGQRAARMDMVNHLTAKATRLRWQNFQTNTGIDPNTLTPEALPNLR